MHILLETERLYLRHFEETDLACIRDLDTDPAVMQYIGAVKTEEESRFFLNKALAYHAKNEGFGYWMIEEKHTQNFVGWAGLKDLDGSEHIEVGYRLSQKQWGKGYATEVGKALLKYGFEKQKLEEIVAVTLQENIASRKVLEKIGLQYQRLAHYYGFDVLFFVITKGQFEQG